MNDKDLTEIYVKMQRKMGAQISFRNPDPNKMGSWTIPAPPDISNALNTSTILMEIRGYILSSFLNIEERLDSIIAQTLFQQTNPTGLVLFKEHILNTKFLTSYSKWQIFRALYNNSKELMERIPEEKRNIISDGFHYLMEKRDYFAHGKIQYKNAQPFLIYYKDGEVKEDELTEKYFLEIANKFREVSEILDAILTVSTENKTGGTV